MADSYEFAAFRCCFSSLQEGLQHELSELVPKLFAKNLVSSANRDQFLSRTDPPGERAAHLLKVLETRIHGDPASFHSVLQEMDSCPTLKFLTAKLRSELERVTTSHAKPSRKRESESQNMAPETKRMKHREREPQQGPSTEASTEEVDGGPSPTTGSQSTDVQSTALRGNTEPTEEMGLQQNPLRRGWREGGYKCKFVEPPPNTDQSKCSVCLLILRDPHQVTCCGCSFCQTCINRVRLNNDPCPTCNEEGFMTFPDKQLQRSLNQLKVHCPHEGSGCEWIGELGKLDKHLNENPADISNCDHNCQYVEVNCLYYAVPFQRRVTEYHQLSECPQRPYCCDYCKEYKASFDDVVNKHHPVCKGYFLSCPNKCEHTIEHQNLEHHVKEECPLTVVECDFHYAGCGVKLPRKDIAGHLAGSLVAHMSLLAVHGKKTAAEAQKTAVELQKALEERDKMREEIRDLERENKTLKERADANFNGLRIHSYLHTPPVTFTMTNFEQHKRNKDTWYSPPFYTHPHGYKMCIMVIHVSEEDGCFVGANLMRGEFDDFLQWPFQSDVYIRILNQLSDDNHITIVGNFPCDPLDNVGMRVTVGERQKYGRGDDIPYATLNCHGDSTENCQYLRDDCIQLQVARVVDTVQLQREIVATVDHRSVRTPPCQFIMRDFEQHKENGGDWYSPSFFTPPQGYRMCLSVVANGSGDARGTHVTVYTHLMCGEFDSHLKWPFQGDITIQILNQLEDKQHHTETNDYTDTTPDEYVGRVTVGERARGWGIDFISHSELGLNRYRNCQYLKDDCLIFHITKIVLK